jgi:hypothetical protein
MNSRYVENLRDGIEERSDLFAKKFREQFEGRGLDMKETRSPRRTVVWFNTMLNWYGPLYSTALQIADPEEYRSVLRAQAIVRGELAARQEAELANYRAQLTNYRLSNEGVIRGEAV